jgi:integrase
MSTARPASRERHTVHPDDSAEPRTRERRNGEGTYRVRADGRYEVRWRDASFQRRSSYHRTEGEARAALARIVADRLEGIPQPTRRYTLGAWLPIWLESMPPARLRPRSRERYAFLLEHWRSLPIASRRLPDVTPEHVGGALGAMHRAGLSVATQASAIAVLRLALDAAVRSGHCGRNVARLIDAPRAEPRPIAGPAGAELERIRRAIVGDPLEALWSLALYAGLRQGEALGLTWADVNTDAGLVRVTGTLQYATRSVGPTKSRAGRRVLPITAEYLGVDVAAILRAHRDRTYGPGVMPHPHAWVFARPDGGPMHARVVLEHWYDVCIRAKVRRYRFHDLRHTAATELLTRHLPAFVSRYLGHSTLAMTDRYAHTELSDAAWSRAIV